VDKRNILQPFIRPISWIMAIVSLGMIILAQVFPLGQIQRLIMIGLALLVGITGILSIRYNFERVYPSRLLVYGGIVFHSLSIAAGEFIFVPLDLSALYFLRIIASALLWDYKAAFVSAFFASIFQPFAAMLLGMSLVDELPIFFLRASIYFLSAFLVSEFARGLRARWQLAMAVVEQQNQEISKRKHELELLFEISQSFGNLQDLDAVLRQLTESAAHALHGEGCMIAAFDAARQTVRGMPPGFGLTDEQVSQFHYLVREEMLATWDINQAQYFISRDPAKLPRELAEFSERYHVNQLVAARMIIQGIPTGYVIVGNKTDGTNFTESDARLLSILAEQIGIIVENARLYAEQQINLQNAARLYAVSTELFSELDPHEIPQRVVDAVAEALETPIVSIALLNEATGNLEYEAHRGIPEDALRIPFRKDGIGMQVLTSGVPRFIENTSQVDNPSRATQLIGWNAMACLPIYRGAKRLGTLYVNYTQPHTFTPAEKNLLAIFANQTAIALENSQLYAREQQRAAELDVISQIGQHVTSILTLDDLLPALVQLIQSKFQYRYIHFFINDNPNHRTILRAVQSSNSQLKPRDFALNFDEGMIGWVASHGHTLVANDVTQEPRYLPHSDVHDTKSELTVPVKVANEIIGVLDVQSDQLNAFAKSRVALFETLAAQVAVAVENARLYGQLQDQARLDSLTQVFNHGYFIDQLNLQVGLALQANLPLSLIMLDIDFYKEYNDRYGHVIGDHVLTEIVQAIRMNIKTKDIVGRWGGEEFGIVLSGASSGSARHVADRIRQTLLATNLATEEGVAIIPPTISQGIASIPEHAQATAALIDLADAALYRAKNRGRDQIQIAEARNKT